MHTRIFAILLLTFCFAANVNANECLKVKKKTGKVILVNKKANGKCPKRTLDMGSALVSLGVNTAGVAGAKGDKGDTGSTGPKGDTGSTGAKGSSGTVKIINETKGLSFNMETNGDSEKVFDFTPFEKVSSTSILKITMRAHVTMENDGTATAFCSIFPRVDNVGSRGNTGTTFISSASGTVTFGSAVIPANQNTSHPITSVAIFTGISSGQHTVSMWARTISVDKCVINSGNFRSYLLIEEIEPEN